LSICMLSELLNAHIVSRHLWWIWLQYVFVV